MSQPQLLIEIYIAPDGTARIVTSGYDGTACKDATRALEQALGIVQSDRPTPELHQSPRFQQRQTEQP